ncbi:steryl deacetylase [Saccharomycopsis crataegensis]|uniref:Steryl deacetylase n=1 Tax=Saccharomycopsis crataegensis TaxID=43959 RepID=A0AAV5QIL7_9ASCO|nr:steryl deacetylase [Saccharomycopsis crataegensis]
MTEPSSTSPKIAPVGPPKPGQSIPEYTMLVAGWLRENFMAGVHVSEVAANDPHIGIAGAMEMISPVAKDFPNFNKPLKIPGLKDDQVSWFVEAEHRTENDPVIIYIHGGGYAFGIYPSMLECLQLVYEGAANPRLSILVLDYTLSGSGGVYPQQLIESSLVYNALCKTSNNIWLMGDSAGAHASLSLVRHIHYPEESLPVIDKGNLPKGLILISPWVNLHPTFSGSYKEYLGQDSLTSTILCQMGELFQPDTDLVDSELLNHYKASKVDWDAILPKHSNIFVSLGQKEVLRDDIEAFIKLAKLQDATVYSQPDGTHDESAFFPGQTPLTGEIIKFVKSIV